MSVSLTADKSPANLAFNGPIGLLRRLSARWKTDKGRHRNKSSSSVESRGAAVPYHDPDVPDDVDVEDYVLDEEPTNSNSGGMKVSIDIDNNEVFTHASGDAMHTSSSLSSALPIVIDEQSNTMELLSATALLRRAQSVGQPASDVIGSHVLDGDQLITGGSHLFGNGLHPFARSKSVGYVQNGNGYLGQLTKNSVMFDVRREVLATLAESGDTERLRAVLKADNEAVNGTDENGDTALHKAAVKGHSHSVRMLLLFGADIELKNTRGDTAVSLAVVNGHAGVLTVLTDYMQSFNKRPQESFVVLRAKCAHVTSPDCYVTEQVRSCAELKSFRRRGINYIHLLVAQGQKVSELAIFLHSALDVPVGHAFFIHGLGSDLNMNNFQRFDDDLHLLNESITVINTRLNSMQPTKFRHLRRLVLVDCNLSELVLDSLNCLEILDVRRNKLTSLPHSIGHCRRLRTLRVASNDLRQLPDRFLSGLRRLVAFDCSFNKLKRLPTHIVQCVELTTLECNDNGLVELPVDIGLLVCLEELRTHNNRLSQLPVSISALTRLRRLSFRGNPLTNIPVDFPERASGVRLYLQSLQEDSVPNKTVKLIVVGQEGVGKTCLLKALRRTSWILPASTSDTQTTDGIEVRDIKLNDVTLRCFDCCGDVDFNETHNFFITRGAIYLVCFNLAEYCMASVERDSFLLGRLQLWLQYIFTKVPDARVILVGTHADHPGLNQKLLEEIWDLLRRMMVDGRDHHRQYFSPCSTPVKETLPDAADSVSKSLVMNVPSYDDPSHSLGGARCAERLTDCLLCQQDSRCYRRSVSATGTSGGFVNLGFTRNITPSAQRPQLIDRSMSGVEEETSFCSGDARCVAFPHVVGYYEVSCIRNVGTTAAASTGPDNVHSVGGGSGQNRGIEHLKTAIYELANKLIEQNPEVPRSWSRVAESLWARRQRDCVVGGEDNGKGGVLGGPMATVDEVAEIAAVQGVKDRGELTSMLQFFKAQGVLLYFPQLADLDELVILDPVWLARIFSAVQSSRDTTVCGDRGFVDRDCLRAIWRTTISNDDPESESHDRRILALLRHFGVCVPVEGTKFELFPGRLPLCDRELDPSVWRPLPDPRRERQVTYSATFPSIIPPPFFNNLIAAFYSYRSESPPTSPRSSSPALLCGSGTSSSTLDMCPQYAHYFADRLVDWLRIDRPGCRDCRSTSISGSGSDADNGEDESSSRGDCHSLYHRVLIELIAHRRTIQVTARGAMPCCAIKKVSRIFDRVVRQFEGLGSIQINSVVCPGCVLASHAPSGYGLDSGIGLRLQKHKYSEMGLVTSLERAISVSAAETIESSRLCCSNGHVIPSTRDLLRGVIGDWFAQHSTGGGVTSLKSRDSIQSQVSVSLATDCPRLFILLPVNRDGLSFDSQLHLFASTLVTDGYAVHLLCEFPDGYHVTCEPGYRLRNPREFIRRYGDHVVLTLRLLGRLANSSVVTAQYATRTRAVARTADALIRDLITKCPALKTAIARQNAQNHPLLEMVSSNQRSLRREELRRHLHLADRRADVFGPLRRLRIRLTGSVEESGEHISGIPERTLWLCDDHVKQMKDASAAIPAVTSFSSAHNLPDVHC